MNKLVCVAGMTGSGKRIISDYFAGKGFYFIRFGQITLDEIIKRKLKPTENNQKIIREEIRKKYGMDAYAKLNLAKIKKFLKKGNVVVDGLYSWSEYKFLKNIFGKKMTTIAVFSPPEMRYERLSKRSPGKEDKELRDHHFNKTEAKKRDFNEIKNIEKGGPIAMADYTILNTKDLDYFTKQIEEVFKKIQSKLR